MRYEYTITKEGGEAEIMKAMSWKKLFKSLLLKYPEFSGWCTYINKKGHRQKLETFLRERRQENYEIYRMYAFCECILRNPMNGQHIAEHCCFDCAREDLNDYRNAASIISFPMDKSIIPDCFSQGHSITAENHPPIMTPETGT